MRSIPVCLLCLIATLSLGCAKNHVAEEKTPTFPGPETPCENVYTYAPGNFIVDIAAGSDVNLDPGIREFPIFCTPEDAKKAVAQGVQAGKLPSGDWRVYKLDGTYQDLGKAVGKGRYVLTRPTRMTDWVR